MKLLEYVRDELIEEEHFGIIKLLKDDKIFSIGEDCDYPYFLRSCAKPLQASLLCDFGFADDLTSEQIAVCCASHAGEKCHIDVIRSILKKYEISEDMLTCGKQMPLSDSAKEYVNKPLQIYNNCSGKHSMMLLISKKMGWDLNTYFELFHPLQQCIKKKIYELCEVNQDYPITKDGCGVPIFSMPLINMLKGYINLFNDTKYKKIKEAFQLHPYLIGGENRLDTAIMIDNSHLIAKVGAGGLCIVFNLEENSAFIVKITDCDMRARAICVIKCLKDLNWLKNETNFLKSLNKTDILTLKGVKVGEVKYCFSF